MYSELKGHLFFDKKFFVKMFSSKIVFVKKTFDEKYFKRKKKFLTTRISDENNF